MGLYAVRSVVVGRREKEFGIRLAVGALPRQIAGLVLRAGALSLAGGVALDAGAGTLTLRFFEPFLYRVETWDVAVLASVLGTVVLTGLLASLAPAARAANVDPNEQLRTE